MTVHFNMKNNLRSLFFKNSPQRIKSIQVKNTCLIAVPNHSNIIQLNLNDASHDFRMHQERTEIRLPLAKNTLAENDHLAI